VGSRNREQIAIGGWGFAGFGAMYRDMVWRSSSGWPG